MLTNSNQSQGPQGEQVPLFGTDKQEIETGHTKAWFPHAAHAHQFRPAGQKRPAESGCDRPVPAEVGVAVGRALHAALPDIRSRNLAARRRPSRRHGNVAHPVAAPGAAANPNGGVRTIENNNTGEKPVESSREQPWLLYLLIGVVVIVLILVGLRAMSNRPAPRAEADGGRRTGGEAATGRHRGDHRHPIQRPDATHHISQWKLLRAGDTLTLQSDQPEPTADGKTEDKKEPAKAGVRAAAGPPIATMSFDEKRRLCVNAAPDTQFHDIKGFNITESNNRQLNIAPGEKLICRVATSESPSATRLELNYNKDRRA